MPTAPVAGGFPVPFDEQGLARLCGTYRIAELSLFGSVTRDDFDPSRSDVDVLVEFEPDTPVEDYNCFATYNLFTLVGALEELFGRKVDLVKKHALHPYIRDSVIRDRIILYQYSPKGGLVSMPKRKGPRNSGDASNPFSAFSAFSKGDRVTKKNRGVKVPDLYLFDMRRACSRVLKLANRMTWDDFVEDERTQGAILNELKDFGEAEYQLKCSFPAFVKDNPAIPWEDLAQFRHFLIHRYSYIELQLDRLWNVIQDAIPPLLAILEQIIKDRTTGALEDKAPEEE